MSQLPPEKRVTEEKNTFRRRWREVLAEGFTRVPARNESLCRRLLADPALLRARRVGLFTARAWEVDLRAIWAERPEACAFPRVVPGTREMGLYTLRDWSSLVAGYAGIPEPPADPGRLVTDWGPSDIIVVPAIYFDRRGHRIGSGMGFYDRFLAGKNVVRWGACWSEQWLPDAEFPVLPHDVPVARVFTDAGDHPTDPEYGRSKSGQQPK